MNFQILLTLCYLRYFMDNNCGTLMNGCLDWTVDHEQPSRGLSQCSASDSTGLIFTRSHRAVLLIKTQTPLLVKN